eukprot:6477491-Amphidinium_carterae.3
MGGPPGSCMCYPRTRSNDGSFVNFSSEKMRARKGGSRVQGLAGAAGGRPRSAQSHELRSEKCDQRRDQLSLRGPQALRRLGPQSLRILALGSLPFKAFVLHY